MATEELCCGYCDTHEALGDDPKHQAGCSCGWKGPERDDLRAALDDLKGHYATKPMSCTCGRGCAQGMCTDESHEPQESEPEEE